MSFIAQFFEVQRVLSGAAIPSTDMRDSGDLETEFVSGASGGGDHEAPSEQPPIEWQEDDHLQPRRIKSSGAPSTIRYFLDGTQKTMRACYIENIPIVAGIVGAGVVVRDANREPSLVPGMTEFKRVWVIPRTPWESSLNRAAPIFEDFGTVVNSLDDKRESDHPALLADFNRMLELGFKRVGAVRQELERTILRRWHAAYGNSGDAILVDGPIRDPVPAAFGLVKSFTRQYLTGEASNLLFKLENGERTASFMVKDTWRAETPIVAWYQRHWSATGRDPRHALIRVEQFANWIDRPAPGVSADWVMRERLPAARADDRWPTLLYPVHHLERILKRQINADTQGWSIPQ